MLCKDGVSLMIKIIAVLCSLSSPAKLPRADRHKSESLKYSMAVLLRRAAARRVDESSPGRALRRGAGVIGKTGMAGELKGGKQLFPGCFQTLADYNSV